MDISEKAKYGAKIFNAFRRMYFSPDLTEDSGEDVGDCAFWFSLGFTVGEGRLYSSDVEEILQSVSYCAKSFKDMPIEMRRLNCAMPPFRIDDRESND